MPFFDDLKNAFNRYAADYVTLAIVDEAYLNGRPDRTPNNIGRGQARRFKVKINEQRTLGNDEHRVATRERERCRK
jgi:hypothetical protein